MLPLICFQIFFLEYHRPERQTVWIQIRPQSFCGPGLGLNCCKGYHQSALACKLTASFIKELMTHFRNARIVRTFYVRQSRTTYKLHFCKEQQLSIPIAPTKSASYMLSVRTHYAWTIRIWKTYLPLYRNKRGSSVISTRYNDNFCDF